MDIIFIRELRLNAWVGIYKREKLAPQVVQVDLEIGVPPAVFKSERVADTIDYAVVVERLRQLFADTRFGLVENMAERIASIIIDDMKAPWVRVSVGKIGIIKEAKRVGVTIERSRKSG
ncbi:MAG: dihydroneopterin aldolase [Betaproteobacteria bacterium]